MLVCGPESKPELFTSYSPLHVVCLSPVWRLFWCEVGLSELVWLKLFPASARIRVYEKAKMEKYIKCAVKLKPERG